MAPTIPELVLDTNVFVSALRSRRGASFRLLSLVETGRFSVNLSVPLVLEYEAVGRRHHCDLGPTDEDLQNILDMLCRVGCHREIYFMWRSVLPDPNDDMVLELAVASGGAWIVTFNAGHFLGADAFGIRV